jgi:molybdate transport system substrate-binding protein
VANPEVAPYGRAARQALQTAGLWDKIEARLVLGENVGQAAQFATTGAAEAGIIANSLAVASDIAPKVTAALIPAAWHRPIDHGMALLQGAGDTARAFAAFVRGPEARAILERNGFSVPAP